MYCPNCLNDTLYLNHKGVAELHINKKHLDNGKFLFNVHDSKKELDDLLEKKIQEFFQWYSKFQNITPISEIEILTNAFSCKKRCKLNAMQKFSLVGQIYSPDDILSLLYRTAAKFGIPVHISRFEDDDNDDS